MWPMMCMKRIAHSTQAKRTIRREETHCTLLSEPFAQPGVDPERLGWLIVTLAQLLKWQSVRPLKLVYMTSLKMKIGIRLRNTFCLVLHYELY